MSVIQKDFVPKDTGVIKMKGNAFLHTEAIVLPIRHVLTDSTAIMDCVSHILGQILGSVRATATATTDIGAAMDIAFQLTSTAKAAVQKEPIIVLLTRCASLKPNAAVITSPNNAHAMVAIFAGMDPVRAKNAKAAALRSRYASILAQGPPASAKATARRHAAANAVPMRKKFALGDHVVGRPVEMSAVLGGRNAPEMAVNVAPVFTRLQREGAMTLRGMALTGLVALGGHATRDTGATMGFAFRRIRMMDTGRQDHASRDHAHQDRGAAMVIVFTIA